MLVGLYGGTFDPVHLGHLHAALSVKRSLKLAHMRMILAARPGHREAPKVSVEHRWNMLSAACAGTHLCADDMEVVRHGRSYTIDTLEAYRHLHPQHLPCWVLGQDAFATLPSWHRWRELTNLCNLIVVERPGQLTPESAQVNEYCRQYERPALVATKVGQIVRLRLKMKDISSTVVRSKIAAGEAWQQLLATPVSTYISQHRLYCGNRDQSLQEIPI